MNVLIFITHMPLAEVKYQLHDVTFARHIDILSAA